MYSVIYVLPDKPDKDKIKTELEDLGWKAQGLVDLKDPTGKQICVELMLRETKV